MLIALSGGADSVALLLMMQERGKAEACAHCNFHLRGNESDRDEEFVRRLCEERGIRLFVKHFDTQTEAARTGESIEMAARRLRYDWFAELCLEHGFKEVAVAHHLNDNAETVLLNLVRGTGLNGLTGMAEERPGVVRPLLSLSRHEILDYLRQKGQTYVTDSTNTDTHYRRNKLRHEVLPLLREMNPQIDRTLHETALRLQGVERIYRYGIAQLKKEVCRTISSHDGLQDGLQDHSHDGLRIDVRKLSTSPAPETLLYELLAPYGLSAEQSVQALQMRVGAVMESPAGYLLTRTTQEIAVEPLPRPFSPIKIPDSDGIFFRAYGLQIGVRRMQRGELTDIPRDKCSAALDADCIKGELILRPIATGDRFMPFGMRGSKLVSDYLTDRHYSRIDKLRAMTVADEHGIVWLVNERPAGHCAVTPATQRIVLLFTNDQ